MWTPDLVGHRTTPWPSPTLGFDAIADRLAQAVLQIAEPRLLLGYSMGGRLGLRAWSRHPELFGAAVLIGVHPGLTEVSRRRERAHEDLRRARRLRRLGVERFFTEWDAQPLFGRRAPRRRDHHRADALASALVGLGLGAMPSCWNYVRSRCAEGRLVVVVGEHDQKFRRLWGALNPVVAPGAHHDVVSDAPEWLAEQLRGTAGTQRV
jgi:2-succinyl-6-hydroxy-2,4-cyclohexadiene-1-carboxylate synthase